MMKTPVPDKPSSAPGIFTLAALVFVLLMAGVAALFTISPDEVANYLAERPGMLPVAGAVLILPVIGLAVYLLRYGSRVVSREEFSRSTQGGVSMKLTGARAVRRGWFIQALAATLLLAALAVPVVLWRLAATMTGSGA